MNKQTFLAQLRKGLSRLPQSDIEERVTFYSEMIDDRMEEGLSEEDAVRAIGSVDAIISQILSDAPPAQKATKKKLGALEIILLVLGSPVWVSLLIAAFAGILSLYASLWAVIVSVWAVFVSLAACALSSIVAGIGFAFSSDGLSGIAMIGAGTVCAGLAIFAYFGCKAATKGTLLLTKKAPVWMKSLFTRKENT
jgi:uncharacterized membrane protein